VPLTKTAASLLPQWDPEDVIKFLLPANTASLAPTATALPAPVRGPPPTGPMEPLRTPPPAVFRAGSSPPFSLQLPRYPAARSARAAIAARWKLGPAAVIVSLGPAPLSDSEPLVAGLTYDVSFARRITVGLVSTEPLSDRRPLERHILITPELRTVEQAARAPLRPPLTPASVIASVGSSQVPLDSELAPIPDGAALWFQHSLPLTGRFSIKNGLRSAVVDVDPSTTLNSVKNRLLGSWVGAGAPASKCSATSMSAWRAIARS
jgi:hypothetical protein